MSKLQVSQVGAETILHGGSWSTGRGWNAAAVPTPAADSNEPTPAELAATPTPERFDTILRNTRAAVLRNGATARQDSILREVAGIAENDYGLQESPQALRDALDQAKPTFTEDALVDQLADADTRATLHDMAPLANTTTLTAQARALFPRIVIEETGLPVGSYIVDRKPEGAEPHYIGWDPAQITRDKVEIWINIYIAGSGEYIEYTPQVYRALRGLENFRTADPDPKAIELWDEVEQQVIASSDPSAVVARISELFTAERARMANGGAGTVDGRPGGQPPTEPPEGGKAQPADGAAGTEAQA